MQRSRSRPGIFGAVVPILVAAGAVSACDRSETPEEALESTLVELRETTERQIAERDRQPAPDEGPEATPTGGPSRETAPGGIDPSVLTPYDVAPEVANSPEVQRAVVIEYPQILRQAGVGGTVLLSFFVTAAGMIENVLVEQTSGVDQLDQAALRVASAFQFTPAQNEGQPVAAWVQVPITFQPGQGR